MNQQPDHDIQRLHDEHSQRLVHVIRERAAGRGITERQLNLDALVDETLKLARQQYSKPDPPDDEPAVWMDQAARRLVDRMVDYERLYHERRRKLVNWIGARYRNLDYEAVAQDAFTTLFRRWGAVDNPTQYLHVIAWDKANQAAKDSRRRTDAETKDARLSEPLHSYQDVADKAVDNVLFDQIKRDIHSRITGNDDTDKAWITVDLTMLQDMSTTEAAQRLDSNPSTLRSRKQWALDKLRRDYNKILQGVGTAIPRRSDAMAALAMGLLACLLLVALLHWAGIPALAILAGLAFAAATGPLVRHRRAGRRRRNQPTTPRPPGSAD
jgi:DNA-directed RNA polymerase specialized sigma24 family protein